jgi:hypothetical protein
LAIPDFDPQAVGDPIDRQEPEIVRRELVLDSWVAQTDDQFHADSLFAVHSVPQVRARLLGANLGVGS